VRVGRIGDREAVVRVFLAGAGGVLGVRLAPLLVGAGHEVAGMTRSAEKADVLRALGAEPVVCDVYDAEALREAVVAFAHDAVMHQLTDLPDDPALIGAGEANARIRVEGTANLVAAARAAGAGRFVAQSIAWTPAAGGAAQTSLEEQVLAIDGVVVRYGQLYGPGTYYPASVPEPPRIQVDEAARRTLPALDLAGTVLTLVED